MCTNKVCTIDLFELLSNNTICFHACSQPAKYLDPVTLLPYHNSHSYKLIREAYYQMLEFHGDKNNAEVAKWVKWYIKNKDKFKTNKTEIKL